MATTWTIPEGINQNPVAYYLKVYSGENVSLLNIPIPIEVVSIHSEDGSQSFWPLSIDISTLTTLENGKAYWVVVHDPLTWTVGAAAPPPASSITWYFTAIHPGKFYQMTYTGNTIYLPGTTMPPELSIVWNFAATDYFIPGDPKYSTFTSLEIGKIYYVVVTAPCTWVIQSGVVPPDGVSEYKELIAVCS